MGLWRRDHSSLIERLSKRALVDLLAPLRPVRPVEVSRSVILLQHCPRCSHIMPARSRYFGQCGECGAHIASAVAARRF